MNEAKPGEWLFEKGVLTDQDDMDVIERTVFAKLLDHLPNVVPYNIGIQLDYFDRNVDGEFCSPFKFTRGVVGSNPTVRDRLVRR